MKIGFIGCGNMAEAIIRGMLSQRFSKEQIYISDARAEHLAQQAQDLGVIASSTTKIAKQCDIVILAVKPQNITDITDEINSHLSSESCVVSILAGVNTTTLQHLLGVGNIIRVMPNTAAILNLSATGMFALGEQNTTVADIFNAIGISVWVENEKDIDSITALSGSGPAYFYLFFEAMIEAATEMGLSPDVARKLCTQTALGAATMAQTSDESIAQLRANVTSKGGTTEAAIRTMLASDITIIIKNAMISAKQRAEALSET